MYLPHELAQFALFEFERGLEGLSEEDAQRRLDKADGTQMNAISWTVGHIAWQWTNLSTRAARALPENADADPYAELSRRVYRFRSATDDPSPPSLAEALALFQEMKTTLGWLEVADPRVMTAVPSHPDYALTPERNHIASRHETIGTATIRNTYHTLIDVGDTIAVREILGHPEIPFISNPKGKLEWRTVETSASVSA